MSDNNDLSREAFLAALDALDLKQTDFARLFNLDGRNISRWGRPRGDKPGMHRFPAWVRPALEQLLEREAMTKKKPAKAG